MIYTKTDVFLSKERYSTWREIQDKYDDYKASLGPWSVAAVISYLNDEYRNLETPAEEQVVAFISGDESVVAVDLIGR